MNNHSGHISDLLQILEISRTLVLNQNLQSLLNQIELAAVKVLGCERATVFVYDNKTKELYSYVSNRAENIRVPSETGILGSCFKSGKLINVADAYQDPRFNIEVDNSTGFKTRNILATPLLSDNNNILGVLEVLNKIDSAFNEWDELLLETLSSQCGVAIHRHSLTKDLVERKRLQQELTIAKSIQRSLLPQSAPVVEGYDIAGWNQSAEETGGDFYDFHSHDRHNLILMLADVSGHGIGPALLAAECWALQRAIFSSVPVYHSCLKRINQLLCGHIPNDRFITAFTGCLNAKDNTLFFLSAGHGPVFMLRADKQCIETLPIAAMPLGIMENNSYDQWDSITFKPGDILVGFTDGFFEWEDQLGNCFGTDRICDEIFREANLPAAAIIEKVYRQLLSFTNGTQQQDDLTAIVIKKL